MTTPAEREVTKQAPWEQLIMPETLEQPLIRVCRNIEKECFDAVFALDLSGIGRRKRNRDEKNREGEKQEEQQERFKKLLITGLSIRQSLDFEYAGGRDAQGKAYFKWRIQGRSESESADEAGDSAKQLWQNLNVIVGALKNEYSFTPNKDEKKLCEVQETAGYVGVIKRVGVIVNAHAYSPVGFQRQPAVKNRASVIVVPEKGTVLSSSFDSLALGATGCASEIKLKISISQVRLAQKDVEVIADAIGWLRNGESKQVSFHEGIKEGVQDKDTLTGLEKVLELWLGNPTGYRVSCTATSKEPIPMSFLKLVGNELFSSPFVVEMRKQEPGDLQNSALNIAQGPVLDLQDCVNSIALLPPLFPQVETLEKCNVKRSFSRAAADLQDGGIILGRVGAGAVFREVRFSPIDRSRHAYIIGATGTGKSTLLYNMIKQDIENGEGVCVIDPHGDLTEQVINAIPARRAEDVVIVNPGDFERCVGINFMEVSGDDLTRSVQMNFITNEMLKIFDRLYDLRQTGGPIFEQYMRNAMLLLMDNEYREATLTDIPLLFEDREFRAHIKKGCKNPLVESFWTKQAEAAGGDASLNNVAPYITSKLNQFTHNALLRPIIGQPESSIRFREIMDEGKILLVNLSKGLLGEFDSQLLGMLIIGKLFSSALGRVSQPQEKRRTMYLYIDEFQNFATDSMAFLLSEARKFGISITLANQNLAQLRVHGGQQSILDSVLGNVGSTMMLRLGLIDSDVLQVYTKPDLDAQDLQSLPDFHVAARLLSGNRPTKPFVFKTLPLAHTGNTELAGKIKILSRLKYAQDRSIVESEIIRRRTNPLKRRSSIEDEAAQKIAKKFVDLISHENVSKTEDEASTVV